MAFRVPTFNLSVRLWRKTPVAGAPTLTFMANLSPGRRVTMQQPLVVASSVPATGPEIGDCTSLLCPQGTDVRGLQSSGLSDVVECPAGTRRFYLVVWSDDVAKGFGNEYRMALLRQVDFQLAAVASFSGLFGAGLTWPVPTP
jgi:hypothetical protein